jgi:aspartokinase
MAKLAEMLSRIRIVPQRSSTLTKIVVVSAAVLSTVALLTLGSAIQAKSAEIEENRKLAIGLEQAIDRLEQRIDELGTVQSIIYIAQTQLGLVDPDTIIFSQPD